MGAPTTLQSIRIGDRDSNWCHFLYWHDDNKFFLNLRSVHLFNVRLPTESFDVFSSHNSPCLEVLELYDCNGFNEIELSSSSIKRLIINTCRIKTAAIDAPNVLYFKLSFEYDVPSPFSFTKNSSSDWKSDICVRCCSSPIIDNGHVLSTWLLKLNVLLKALRQSQISLDIDYRLEIDYRFFTKPLIGNTLDEGLNEPVVVEHLSLSGSVFPDFIKNLFIICRPRYIEGKEIGRESVGKVLIQEIEKMDCLWIHDLEDISTEELKDVDEDDAEEWLHFLDSSLSKKIIRLRLKWKE